MFYKVSIVFITDNEWHTLNKSQNVNNIIKQ